MTTTYAGMVNKIEAWMEDEDVEFSGSVADMLALAETAVQRDLDLGIFSAAGTRTATIGDPLLQRPVIADALVFMHVYTDVAGVRHWLVKRSADFVTDYLSDLTNGIPKYYSEYNETQWLIAPRPAGAYAITGRALVHSSRLSATNTVTWVSTHVDDLLFKACLAEAEGFVKDDARVALWRQQYFEALPNTKREIYNLLIERYEMTPMETPAQPTIAR